MGGGGGGGVGGGGGGVGGGVATVNKRIDLALHASLVCSPLSLLLLSLLFLLFLDSGPRGNSLLSVSFSLSVSLAHSCNPSISFTSVPYQPLSAFLCPSYLSSNFACCPTFLFPHLNLSHFQSLHLKYVCVCVCSAS